MKRVIAYTDGSCLKGGKGGWAWKYSYPFGDGFSMHDSGFCRNTTNQRMELMAMHQCLKNLPMVKSYEIFSDSKYVLGTIGFGKEIDKEQEIFGWMRDWNRLNRWGDKSHIDLLKEIEQEVNTRRRYASLMFRWVKGHSHNEGNDF